MNLSRTLGAFGAALLLAAAGNLPEREQRRLARNFVGGHGRGTRRYSWLPTVAFNYYATASERNAAKRARRERAQE